MKPHGTLGTLIAGYGFSVEIDFFPSQTILFQESIKPRRGKSSLYLEERNHY